MVEAKRLLDSGRAESVQDATDAVGISRSSFYKYKDDIFPYHENAKGKTITMVIQLDDDFAMGKARVLPTPCGKTLEGLIRGGVHMGVSSRGTGSLGNDNVVCEDFNLITIDAVFMPSCPDAYVEAVNESVQWVLNESTGLYIQQKVKVDEAAKQFKKTVDKHGSKSIVRAFKDYMNVIKGC